MNGAIKAVIAPDSYKGSLDARGVAFAMEKGIMAACPNAAVICIPIADGGEGFTDAMLTACGGKKIYAEVSGPLGSAMTAYYGVLPDETAVIETAAASGLTLVPPDKRDPMHTTTHGTGELMLHAAKSGCKKMIIGLGGSATNDGGMGMLRALGVRFYDRFGFELPWCGSSLAKVVRIDASGMDECMRGVEITVASDVNNPLCGPEGAAAVFGPQKGADYDMVYELDRGMRNYADVINRAFGIDIADVPGAGAAGGMGAALMVFFGARLLPGIDIVLDKSRAAMMIADSDIVFTGEGRTDAQTTHGKAPMGVAVLASRYSVPVVCISGSLDSGYEALYDAGVTAIFAALTAPVSLEEAMDDPADRIAAAAEAAARLYLSGRTRI